MSSRRQHTFGGAAIRWLKWSKKTGEIVDPSAAFTATQVLEHRRRPCKSNEQQCRHANETAFFTSTNASVDEYDDRHGSSDSETKTKTTRTAMASPATIHRLASPPLSFRRSSSSSSSGSRLNQKQSKRNITHFGGKRRWVSMESGQAVNPTCRGDNIKTRKRNCRSDGKTMDEGMDGSAPQPNESTTAAAATIKTTKTVSARVSRKLKRDEWMTTASIVSDLSDHSQSQSQSESQSESTMYFLECSAPNNNNNNYNDDDEDNKLLSQQPGSTTSLHVAQRFFQQLDATHKLNVVAAHSSCTTPPSVRKGGRTTRRVSCRLALHEDPSLQQDYASYSLVCRDTQIDPLSLQQFAEMHKVHEKPTIHDGFLDDE